MTSTKNYTIGLVLVVTFLIVGNVRADLTTQYGINIIDDKNGDVGFYQTFNKMFGTTFTSSNAIFNAFGVDPDSTWTVSEQSTLVGGDKNQSGFSGALSMYNDNGAKNSIATAQTVLANNTLQLGIDYAIDSNVYLTGSGVGFQLDVSRNVGYESQNYSLQSGTNADGKVYMLALNITDLYNTKYGNEFDSVYMFLWEDWKSGTGVRWGSSGAKTSYTDWDYADFIYIMTNVNVDGSTVTPEPATLAIIGLGLAGLGLARRRMTK